MRRITLVIVLGVFLSAVFVLQTTTPTVALDATATPTNTPSTDSSTGKFACPMTFYVDLMQNDLRAIDDTPSNVMESSKSAIQFLVKIVMLRQKYEDMDVPATCLPTKLQVIVLMANEIDLVSLNLATLIDTQNAQKYNDQLDRQIKRVTDAKLALGKLLPNLG